MLRIICWCGSERHPFCGVTKKSIGHLVDKSEIGRSELRVGFESRDLAGASGLFAVVALAVWAVSEPDKHLN
mgnify:CR=1 FL=1